MVQQRNAEQLSEAIEMLIRDKEARFALGKKGKRKVTRDFNLRTIAACLLEILNSHERKQDPGLHVSI
jgi:glycosyltransferase involved in cell wall biosynthesis